MSTPTRRNDKLDLGPVDFTETRVSGYHAYWPQDLDTRDRLVRILEAEDSRPSIVKPLLVGVVILLVAMIVGFLFRR